MIVRHTVVKDTLITATVEQVVNIFNEIQLNESGARSCNTHLEDTRVYVASLKGCCLTGGAGLPKGLNEWE